MSSPVIAGAPRHADGAAPRIKSEHGEKRRCNQQTTRECERWAQLPPRLTRRLDQHIGFDAAHLRGLVLIAIGAFAHFAPEWRVVARLRLLALRLLLRRRALGRV